MLLTDTQKNHIRRTWKLVQERCGNSNAEIGRAIFIKLFVDAPQTQMMFPFKDETMEELQTSQRLGRHGANFVRHLEHAIDGMDKLFSDAGPRLVGLGSRHYTYGVKAADYEVAGGSLLSVLKDVLKDDYTDEVQEAWTAIYAIVAEAMAEGGRDH